MNARQKLALENHCRFAFETAQPKFITVDEDERASINLTVNSGYE
jgi:hypothetical protein